MEKVRENDELDIEYPDKVYFNLSKNTAPIAVTLPKNPKIYLPKNYNSEQSGEISLVVKAPGKFQTFPFTPKAILNHLKYLQPDIVKTLSPIVEADHEGKITTEVLIKFIDHLMKSDDPSGQITKYTHSEITKLRQEASFVQVTDNSIEEEIIGAIFHGKFIPFDKLAEIKHEIDKDLDLFKIIGPQEGSYLYRAVDNMEYQNILRDK